MATLLLILLAVLRLTSVATAVTQLPLQSDIQQGVQVNLRIEGALHTIFEGPVVTSGHNVTTPSSNGTHHCDGKNHGAHVKPGPTATTALDDASKAASGFKWDATFFPSLDDFFITSIGDSNGTACQSWGLVVNYRFSQVGGCQAQVQQNDQVLWAIGVFGKGHFLNLTGPSTGLKNQPITITVTDASNGLPIAGACVSPLGVITDGFGNANVTFVDIGVKSLKAERSDSVRSNTLNVTIS